MDTLHFARPKSRYILHHARCEEDAASLLPDSSAASAQSSSAASTTASLAVKHRSRVAREVVHRTIDEHALNREVDICIPRLRKRNEKSIPPLDLKKFFASVSASTSPHLFYYDLTLPFSTLLSDTFLTRYFLPSSYQLFGLTLNASIDHCNSVQLTPPGIMRLYVDTDTFEALGIEAPAAHSEFSICSDAGARSIVRERLLTIDLREHAKQLGLHTSTSSITTAASSTPAAATAASASAAPTSESSSTSKPASTDPAKNKHGDKRLARLRWVLNRCAPIRLRMMVYDADAACCISLTDLADVSEIKRVDIQPELYRFDTKQRSVCVPDMTQYTQFLPPLSVVEEVEAIKAHGKKMKRELKNGEEQKELPSSTAAPTCTSTHPSSSNHFPLLHDGTSSQDIWNDTMNYLGLVHARMLSCLEDPNNKRGQNVFIINPICPYLEFHESVQHGDEEEEAMMEEVEKMDEGEEDGIMSLTTTSKKKTKPTSSRGKRKRATSASEESKEDGSSSLSATSNFLVDSLESLRYTGILPSSFLLTLYSRCRTLLASSPSIPFVTMTVRGFDESAISWRDKQHQIWMRGSGGGVEANESGGGENGYTIIIMPESEELRTAQQYVVCMAIGELDRTH